MVANGNRNVGEAKMPRAQYLSYSEFNEAIEYTAARKREGAELIKIREELSKVFDVHVSSTEMMQIFCASKGKA